MELLLLLIADKFFFIIHAIYTLFSISGWIWRKTRKLNLIFLLATAFSWLGLGLIFGMGYCPLTDWHWRVRIALGDRDIPRSYIKFFMDEITGMDWNAQWVDIVVAVCFILAVLLSVSLNIRDYLKKRRKKMAVPPL